MFIHLHLAGKLITHVFTLLDNSVVFHMKQLVCFFRSKMWLIILLLSMFKLSLPVLRISNLLLDYLQIKKFILILQLLSRRNHLLIFDIKVVNLALFVVFEFFKGLDILRKAVLGNCGDRVLVYEAFAQFGVAVDVVKGRGLLLFHVVGITGGLIS